MIGITVHGGLAGASSAVSGTPLVALASWQVAMVAFGFVLAMLVLGFVLERWGVGLHA